VNEEHHELSLTDLPPDLRIDKKAIDEGFRWFWANNQITGFKRDKYGEYVRDEDGNLIAYRTSKARVMNTGWFAFKNENNYNEDE
jgi:hypothetical protein